MSTYRLFSLSTAATKAKGQNIVVFYSGQWCCTWITRVCKDKVNSLIIPSPILFWWRAPTPQNVKVWIFLHNFFWKYSLKIFHYHRDSVNRGTTFRVIQSRSNSLFASNMESSVASCMRWTFTNRKARSTKTIAPQIRAQVIWLFFLGTSPGCADTIWSVSTCFPGALISGLRKTSPESLISFLWRHGWQWTCPKSQDTLGGC